MADDIAFGILPEHFRTFVLQEIAEGRFHSAQEVLTAGLELLEEREQRLAALRAAIAESERTAQTASSVTKRPA